MLHAPASAQDFNHAESFGQLPVDVFHSDEAFYATSTQWYIQNYDFAKYTGYQELLKKFDRHLPTGKGITVLQAEGAHTPDAIGDVKHLFDFESSDSHSEAVAEFLSEVSTYPALYTRYSTFSIDLDNFHTADTSDLRHFNSQLTSSVSYPATSYDDVAITPAKLLNVSNTNGGSRAIVVRHFDKFVEENDMVACTAHSGLVEGNWTTSGTSYNSIVVEQYYGNPSNFDGTKMNDHGAPRYKPDLVARSGSSYASSWSSPTVCSAAAVLLERAAVDAAVANAYNSVVVKALLLAGATRYNYRLSTEWSDTQEIANPPGADALPLFYHGEWQRPSDAYPTSPKYGAGHMNVLATYDILDAGEFNSGGSEAVADRGWDYASGLSEGDVGTYPLTIDKESVFSAVLVWHRYIDDSFSSYLPDYAVSVYDEDEARVAHSDNLTSNVELVEVKLPAGSYRMDVRVKSDGGSPDGLSYGLAWISKEVVSPAPQGLSLYSSPSEWQLTWDSDRAGAAEGRKYRLQVSADNQFSLIEKDVYLDAPAYTYSVPGDGRTRHFRVYAYPEDGDVAYYYPSSPRSPQSRGGPGPLTAAFAVEGATCAADLCRAVTGEAVRFVDTSSGSVQSRRWEFGDGNTSPSRRVDKAWSSPGFYEVTLSVSDGSNMSTARRKFLVEAAEPKGTCVADEETRCLQDSRFAVVVGWWTGDGESGPGTVVQAGTNDSGLFTFFNRENWEILIKVLDGCALNGHMWVYGASTTDLGYRIRVTDTLTEAAREYRNEPGLPAPAITDAKAFPDGCQP